MLRALYNILFPFRQNVTKVYIWYPSWSSKQVGHAAITLDDGTHISWWPTEKIEGKKSKKNPREIGSLSEDIALEGRAPDITFKVTGLNERNIKAWWEAFLDAGEKYNLFTRNCCHIVMNALKAGGFKCRAYAENLLKPRDVESLVKAGEAVAII